MSRHVRVILPLEFSEVDSPAELKVRDASAWKFVPNRVHTDSDLLVEVRDDAGVAAVTPMIRQALDKSRH